MKRSPLITIVNVLQSCLGLVLAGLTVYVLALTRSRETLSEPDASETVHGLLIGAAVLGVPALITLIAAWGLWKRRFWGWALSLATDVGVLAVFVYNIVGENDREGDEIALAAGFVVPAILLLLASGQEVFLECRDQHKSVILSGAKDLDSSRLPGKQILRAAQDDSSI